MTTSDNTGVNTSTSKNFREETSAIVTCVTKYCNEKLKSLQNTRARQSPLAIDSNAYTEKPNLKELNEKSDGMGEQTTGQVRVRVDAPESGDLAHFRSWKDDQGSACKSCIVSTENVHEPCCRWEALKPPILYRMNVETYSDLKQSGDKLFRRMVKTNDTSFVAKEAKLPNVWNYSNVFSAEDALRDDSPYMKLRVNPYTLTGPRRMQCDWCEMYKSAEDYLRGESDKVLQKVIQANAQAMFFTKEIVVPSVFSGKWWSHHTNDVHTGEPQQLLLPFSLVRDDEERILQAPSKMIAIASNYLGSLQRTDVSLTKASLNVPCIWNHAIASKGLANLVAEDLKVNDTRATSSTCSLLPIVNSIESKPVITSPKVKADSSVNGSLEENDPLPEGPLKPSNVDELSTDYLVSDQFRLCNWSERQEISSNNGTLKDVGSSESSVEPLKFNQLLQQLARPSMWDLMRKKMIHVDKTSFQCVLDCVSLKALEAIICNQCLKVRKMSLNPSGFSSTEIIEVCASLRQAAWLHTLRFVAISQEDAARKDDTMAAILTRILPSVKYKLLLGSSNWKDLHTLLKLARGRGAAAITLEPSENGVTSRPIANDSTLQPPLKTQRTSLTAKEKVRVLCSLSFLQQDELLDELCTEQQIFFIERDLPTPIDMLIDERNSISVVTGAMFKVETSMKSFIFNLARLQVQFQKCWLIVVLESLPDSEMEDTMNLFHSALVQFQVEIQVLTSFSCEEAAYYVRAVIDQCAEVAFNDYRILPRMWFERPFLIEDESQLERFLVSTRIINNYAAQSLLHKICMNDLFTKRCGLLFNFVLAGIFMTSDSSIASAS
ncbi:hypothetical protein PsorP6_001206 [Peronosclerospora sorghi]|uniref:Uncharacterized protein n=1 Tax=Peronosclerospora sorghi TaxID=230839 RepID=A0ACC0WRT8_9STRA|nr:hypothetical protein PsorP6_001206 [Peronosclerospora sorghi]